MIKVWATKEVSFTWNDGGTTETVDKPKAPTQFSFEDDIAYTPLFVELGTIGFDGNYYHYYKSIDISHSEFNNHTGGGPLVILSDTMENHSRIVNTRINNHLPGSNELEGSGGGLFFQGDYDYHLSLTLTN